MAALPLDLASIYRMISKNISLLDSTLFPSYATYLLQVPLLQQFLLHQEVQLAQGVQSFHLCLKDQLDLEGPEKSGRIEDGF